MGAFTGWAAWPLAGLAAAALAGCGSLGGSGATAPCPRVVILADGADLTRYRPGAPPDLTQMALDARIAGFDARCAYVGAGRQALQLRLTPRFEAERGPAAEGRTAEFGWFAAVTDGSEEVLDRVAATTRVSFPANASRGSATGPSVQLELPLAGRRAADYLVRLSFQLTPEELERSRRRGPR